MIWLKRLSPFVIIAVIAGTYYWYDQKTTEFEMERADRTARMTASVWIASARYHNEPERYIGVRDSILSSSGLSPDSMQAFLKIYRDAEEEYAYFVKRVQHHIDSMYIIEDSLIKVAHDVATRDSLKLETDSTDLPQTRRDSVPVSLQQK